MALSYSAVDVNGDPVSGIGVIFDWNPQPLTSGGTTISRAYITAGSSVADGYYVITVTGTDSSGLTTTTEIDAMVQASFSMYAE